MQYPPDMRIIRVTCTGRVDPGLVADAFVNGADGVMVVGCHFGDCHYISGNYMAKHKLDMTGQILAYAGLNRTRLQFSNLSSAEGAKFAQYTAEFVEQIQKIGPLGSSGDRLAEAELREKLKIAHRCLAGPKLRWVIGKKPVFIREGNKYGEVFTEHEINRTISGIIMDEMATHTILAALEKHPAAIIDIAKELEIQVPDVLRYVLALKRRGLVEIDQVAGRSPIYKCKAEEVRC